MNRDIREVLQRRVYSKCRKEKGYAWIKTIYQKKTIRDIFSIPNHIPDVQIKDWVREKNENR